MKPLRNDPAALAAAALLAVAGPVAAAEGDEDVASLAKPQSEVSLGVGRVSKDNQRFGQYNGLNEKGGYLLLDGDVVRRDDATGTWLKFRGRNLGLDSRELRFEHNRQGDWGYFIDFSQTPRFDPYTVSTRLSGIGSTTQTTNGNPAAQEYHLKTERKSVTLGLEKALVRDLALQVQFRNEEKEGARLWGQGTFGTWRFLTDPIDQTTRQLDATLSYAAGPLQLTGGYYGTSFASRNNLLNVPGCALFTGCDSMALPPDNQSHQLHLAGGYNLGQTTRATFKLARGQITQNESFATAPVAGAPGDLGGRIDTTLAQVGLTARPSPRLSLRADLRYENRDDRTPIFRYFPSQNTVGATNDGTNEARDIKTTSGKLEASYRLPLALRLTGGVEYVEKKRNSPPVRSVDFREKTDETTYRAELRRSISETVTGAVSAAHSVRRGSDWLVNVENLGTGRSTGDLIAPLHLADRDRDTVGFTVNWMPTEPLSLNFRVDESRDKYKGRGLGGFDLGPRKGEAHNYSADAGYALSEAVQATAWVSRNVTQYENALCRDTPLTAPNVCLATAAQPVWGADLRNVADSFGMGLHAKPHTRVELSADLTQSKVRDEMGLMSIAPAVSVASTPLDSINTKVITLKLSAKYALQRNSGVRVQFVHDRYTTDDWTWASWTYSDGTTVRQEPKQKVSFVGLSYYYDFR
jgi:MtrB/PioB family decaheme-associated outer membrane protein